MTYIEFFDKIASENISACLTYIPDRVIYRRQCEAYEKAYC